MHDDLTGALFAPAAADDAGAIRFRQVRDFGDTLNVTFRFLRENMRELGKGLLVIAGPFVLLAAIGSLLTQSSLLDATTAAPGSDPFAFLRLMASPAYLVSMLLGFLAPLVVMAVTFAYTRLYRQGEAGTITPVRLWEETRPLLLPLAGTTLALVFMLGVAGLVNIIPCLGQLAYLGLLLYVGPIFAMTVVARVHGEPSVSDAFRYARDLVRGHWGLTFGVLFIAWVLLFIALMAVSMLTTVPIAVMSATGSADETRDSLGVFMTISTVLGAVISFCYALPFLAHVFQYHNLVERNEGTGLTASVAALATPPAPRDADAPDAGFGARSASPDAPAETPPPAPPAVGDAPTPPDVSAPPPARGFQGGGFEDDPTRPRP